ncbi:14750_t:CDS:2, partial [Dentiscutata heterogama]
QSATKKKAEGLGENGLYYYDRPSGSVSDPYPTAFEEDYDGGITFLAFGDWGQKGPGTGQPQVASAMKTWADANKTTFVLSLGDNYYQTNNSLPVTDPNDHEAGNHDWYTNVTAEVDYFWDVDWRFFLPSLYYVRKVKFGDDISAVFIHIDTDPFYYNYTSYNNKNNLKQTLNDFKLYTSEQINDRLKWIEDQLIDAHDADWIFVVGHHPLIGDCRLQNPTYYLMYLLPPVFTKYNVSAYFNGHAHDLSYSAANSTSPVTYFGSGAGGALLGSGCPNPDWTSPYTFGFLSVSIPADGKTLTFDFVNANSTDVPPKVVYSGQIKSRKG